MSTVVLTGLFLFFFAMGVAAGIGIERDRRARKESKDWWSQRPPLDVAEREQQ